MGDEYTYAVARIRAKELSLLSKSDIDTLVSCRSLNECLRFLSDKGWQECKNDDFEQMLTNEEDVLWRFMNELIGQDEVLNVFRYPIDFHNVKASVKAVVTGNKNPEIYFLNRGTISGENIYNSIKNGNFDELPDHISECAKEAFHRLVKTGDGQMCDIIIDRKSLEYILITTSKSKNEFIRDYGELTTAAADIKIAIRCLRTGKTLEFIKQALAPCRTLNIYMLSEAASKTVEDVYDYLKYTDYSLGVEYLEKSLSEFERYCDNILMEKAKEQKSDSFTISPIFAYFLARQNEFKTVRIILSGKRNSLDERIIKERLRDMYV